MAQRKDWDSPPQTPLSPLDGMEAEMATWRTPPPMLGEEPVTAVSGDQLRMNMGVRVHRLLIGTSFVVAVLVTAMILSQTIYTYPEGVEEGDRKKKLDMYNSRSGSVTSLFMKPIEMTATMLLAVMVLCFATRFVVVSEPTWTTKLSVLAVSVGVSYLLSNGLASLNIQLLDGKPVAHMSSQDLMSMALLHENNSAPVSSVNNLWSERTPKNAITNTIMRTAIYPPIVKPLPKCSITTGPRPSSVSVNYGFRLNTWQNFMFQNALDQEFATNNSIKIYMNETRQNAAPINVSTLPMNVSMASNLLTNGLMFAYSWVRWWNKGLNYNDIFQKKFQTAFGNRTTDDVAKGAKQMPLNDVLDLVAPTNGSVDPAQWLATRSRALLRSALAPHVNISYIASSIKFKHMDLSDDITMDIITFELPLWKGYLDRRLVANDNSTALVNTGLNHSAATGITERSDDWEAEQEQRTVYYDLDTTTDCGPWSPQCLVESLEYLNKQPMVPEHRIRAVGVCLNDDGTEDLVMTEQLYKKTVRAGQLASVSLRRVPACNQTSKNAMFIAGSSYRIVGDAMVAGGRPNTPTDEGEKPSLSTSRATLVNPRKVYTFSVARIGWKHVNLAKRFHATCDSPKDNCEGLSFPLEREAANRPPQHLVVSKSLLPTDVLQPYAYADAFYDESSTQSVPICQTAVFTNQVNTQFFDLALGHNFQNLQWAPERMSGENCSVNVDKYVHTVVSNHFYMEGTLQPVYTSALFFLFQNAGVKEVLQDAQADPGTLKCDRVVTPVDVVVSIPDKNAMMTIVGCGLLVFACIGVVIVEKRRALQRDVTADTAVRVLMDQSKYPAFLLRKNVVANDKGQLTVDDGVVVDRIALRAKRSKLEHTETA
ncbi:TPA: hypothetical protein N0F65_004731 [Lagenidium giganteum]|uniref:Transmembrane protein n=1 Tax=Lagenidium giganteum TaxID=4803 RepID=A0AAV2YMH0_9STRA|nr:TPA: hypothetical protein N0F65_004731 [Lagenidium giganteum]